ncbi:MAG TPA: CDP-alcohol phosphatidyltransferase family protein [Phycicoccus elongatus]|jgi:cardiolipin synthase|uniref:Putative CDP-diacylglycerol--glycerol-3-phosphate 3-phosphatidyl-transferase 1 n=1 Tax=Phycicoccus elongatus Lp2 TaxID=1193181 RepID=N0E5G7_9MICO|nr:MULTISPECIES: CDP-alcohol phosphatidyltransferase family protein [Phycicoccus]MBK8727882.1 CDP-alcohol phosphatidyltransferase family protein [Tetrasphaera sp.]MCA0322733.1 CDP-alcohol phosphatidyltransferase family protein [Actinomycetota bacterium]MCB1240838.1 CDP-alcohol phosphatidyltransferase family protein [Tetrasphaera sp.]MCB9405504.1 CDP-alcohol phosphatidyltransferase family protein [Tetrasphaera sp.]MCO5301752.1 CDP-alcohol phosphatidyltransferase family protein [Phycicoccus sp.]
MPETLGVSGRVLTLPNALSALRLLGVPLFVWAILTHRDGLALIILTLSGITDYLDGKIARKFGLVSRVGQLLDPIADRLYIVSTLLCLAWREIIPWWVVIVLFAREAFMAVVVLIAKKHGWNGLPVHFVGKAATFNLLYAFPLLLLADGDGAVAAAAQPIAWGFAWWGIVLYWVAGILYAVQLRLLVAEPATA